MEHHPRGKVHHDVLSNSFAQNLDVLGDVLWMVTYVTLIVMCFREQRLGIPAIAVCLNFTWELVYTFIHPPPSRLHVAVQLLWVVLDCVIVFQLFRFGSQPKLSKRHYNALFLVGVVLAFFGHLIYIRLYNSIDPYGSMLAYFINLVMSVTFITMILNRRDMKGISYVVAWSKMLATGVITLSVWLMYHDKLEMVGMLLYVGLCTALFDIYYIYLVHKAKREAADEPAKEESGVVSPATT